MENVVHVEMIQRFKSVDEYLSYITSKFGPTEASNIQDIAEKVDFKQSFNRNFVCRIVGGDLIHKASSASIFNLIEIASAYSLKVANPIIVCLMYIQVLDNPVLKAKFGSLFFVVESMPSSFRGFMSVMFYNTTKAPLVNVINYANFTFDGFRAESGFVFEVRDTPAISAALDRV